MRSRYNDAFRRYSREDSRMRALQARLPSHPDGAVAQGVDAQCQALALAEGDYRAIRLEYIGRLLAGE